ncbi:unnamed protein product [Prunus armeniaca]|uniref:IBB domain-containing protein n=1 Tax=Prunus armeniaca TaxID=36596 RepID=A0A6J5XWZ2_PRUAR|nr:unnamed protein product [Prunus armeniaca]
MSLRPSTTTVVRKKSYKTGVEIRKNKREDNLLKKRREGLAPSQQQLLDGTQTTVVFQKTVVWALGNVAGDSPSCRDLVLGQGALMPLLAQLNEHSKLSMVGNATWTLSNFCRGKPATPFDQVKPDLPILRQLIYLNDEEVLTDACWALSYLSDGPNDKIQAVIEAGVCQRLVDLLIHLASRGCIKPLCDLLICPDPRIMTVCLEGPENILKVGEADKEMGMNDGINLYAQLVDECEGLDKIDNLQTHDNSEIYEKAVKILERDWAEEEEEGWGTTNIAFISNGCGTIYVGVDSRTTCKGFIKNDDSNKYMHMEHCNVFATRAGNTISCKKMLEHVEEHYRHKGKIINGIRDASEFEASTLMSGWKVGWNGVGKDPFVCRVRHSGVRVKTKSNQCTGFVNGSGASHASKYLDGCNLEVQVSNELLQHVIRALLYATLFDESSGGYVRVFEVLKQGGYEIVYNRPVLRALLDHYDALASYLSKSLFFLFDKLDYNYTHDINVKVQEGFQRQFDEEYKKNVVITQGQTYTVRLLHFKNPIDELYERLERKNSQRVVLPEVRYLSSVRIEEIGEAPILCGKITQELVRNLREI